ncbi:MAG: UPF0104 family protein [Deltaproteobacteria bacterium]|nr:MAG: UPF0104 family protein [Deltaproteobacteria bacterium]
MARRRAVLGLSGGWWARIAASIVLGGFLLHLVDQQIDVVPADLRVPWSAVGVFAASLCFYFLFRTGRWWFLVRSVGPISFRDATLIALAGTLWVVALPFRLGEFVRPYLTYRRTQIPMEVALGTVAVERLVDGLFVCALFFGMIGNPPTEGPLATMWSHALGVVGLFAVVLLLSLLLARFPDQAARMAHRLVGQLWPAAAERAANFLRGLAQGLTTLPSLRPLLPFLAATAAYWAVNVGGLWLMARQLGLPISFLETGAAVAVLNMVLLVPAGPAMTGSYQAGLAIGLAFFLPADVVRGPGVRLVFWSYVVQIAFTVLLGVAAHLLLGVSAKELTQPDGSEEAGGDRRG